MGDFWWYALAFFGGMASPFIVIFIWALLSDDF